MIRTWMWFALPVCLLGCSNADGGSPPEPDAPAPAPHPAAATASPVARVAPARERPARVLSVLHETRTWALEWNNATYLDALDEQAAASREDVRVTGSLRAVVTAVSADHASVCLQVTGEVSLSGERSPSDPSGAPSPSKAMAAPLCYEVAPTGGVSRLSLSAEARAEPLVAGVLVSIAGALHPVLAGAGRARWTAAERDLLGSYEARYRWDGGELVKEKAAHDQLFGALAGAGRSAATLSARYALDGAGWVHSVHSDEQAVLTPMMDEGAAAARISSRTRLDLAAVGGPVTNAALAAELARATRDAAPVSIEELSRDLAAQSTERSRSAAPSLDDVQTALATLGRPSGAPDDATQSALVRGLARLLRADGAAAAKLLAWAAGPQGNEAAAVMIFSAFGAIGDAACQSALRAVLRASREYVESLLRLAIIHTGSLRAPEPATVAAMRALARQAEGAARLGAHLALGRLASRVADPAEALAIEAELIAAHDRSASRDDRNILLGALGNTRSPRPEVARVLRAAAASADVETRSHGVDAFSLIPGEEADSQIREAMRTDREAVVRLTAVRASYDRSLAVFLPVYRAVLDQDASADVRRAVVDHLGLAWKGSDEARALLVRAAEKDADTEVRRAAAEALGVRL